MRSGVLTKPDKTDADSARDYQRINQKYPLTSEWFVLKLPNSRELAERIAPAEARQRAETFFRSNENWRDYARAHHQRVGVANLTGYLADRLSEQLRQEYV